MAKYVYPAIFTPEDVGGYSIRFPDLDGCYTQGEDLADGMAMANDALCLTLYGLEEDGKEIPPASRVNSVEHEPEEFVSLVACDTLEYRKFFDNKAVKKTLSIPSWLNDLAERNGVNFSGVLQEALKQKLNIG
jgi:predicted RNase H-like HicB family nuclease